MKDMTEAEADSPILPPPLPIPPLPPPSTTLLLRHPPFDPLRMEGKGGEQKERRRNRKSLSMVRGSVSNKGILAQMRGNERQFKGSAGC